MWGIKLLFLLFLALNAHADEKAVYVGDGRYACDGDSADCAVIKQRNQDQARRAQERDEDERRYERERLRETDSRRNYESSRH